MPFLSLNKKTFGTLGFSPRKVWIFPEVISMILLCRYFEAVFWILSMVMSSWNYMKKYGNLSGGNWNGRINLESGEVLNALVAADLGILIAVDGSDPEHSIILVGPFIEFLDKARTESVYANIIWYLMLCRSERWRHSSYFVGSFILGPWSSSLSVVIHNFSYGRKWLWIGMSRRPRQLVKGVEPYCRSSTC